MRPSKSPQISHDLKLYIRKNNLKYVLDATITNASKPNLPYSF